MYIYLYIIYNIIKNKKKEPTHRVAHIHTEKPIYNKSCGLRFEAKSLLEYIVSPISGAIRNLQLWLHFTFRGSSVNAFTFEVNRFRVFYPTKCIQTKLIIVKYIETLTSLQP